MTSGIGGLFGWFLQLVVAYTVIDIPGVLTSPLGQPWVSYLLQVLPQKVALAAASLTIIAAFSMGQGCMVSGQAHRTLHGESWPDNRYRLLLPESPSLTPAMTAFPFLGG